MTRGKYSTKQKDIIFDIISHMNHSFSVKYIFDQLSGSTSITTIYRLIDQLECDGVVEKIIESNGNVHYQYIEKCDCDHFYLKCEKCGALTHVECDFINELSDHVMEDHSFHLNKEHIIMNGICKDCYQKEG